MGTKQSTDTNTYSCCFLVLCSVASPFSIFNVSSTAYGKHSRHNLHDVTCNYLQIFRRERPWVVVMDDRKHFANASLCLEQLYLFVCLEYSLWSWCWSFLFLFYPIFLCYPFLLAFPITLQQTNHLTNVTIVDVIQRHQVQLTERYASRQRVRLMPER